MPFIGLIFANQPVELVPILVGALSPAKEKEYGQMLAKYLNDEETLFVVSSDFCHWGDDFDYKLVVPGFQSISKSIQALDFAAMDIIAAHDSKELDEYLEDTDNTICGRHAIAVYLHALESLKSKHHTRFLSYAQSGEIESDSDSSVSYAAAVTTLIN